MVSQPPFKNTTEPSEGKVVCASSESGLGSLGSRSPTDSCNIPPFWSLWGDWWTLRKLSQATKKGEETFGFSPLSLLYGLHLTYVFPYPQTGEHPQYANSGNQDY